MQVPFSMAIENVELMHKCSPEHLRTGAEDWNETKKQKEGKQQRVKMKGSTACTKKSPDGLV